MSWKDRAEPVGDWKSQAEKVAAPAAEPSTLERIKGLLSSGVPDFSANGQAGAALRGFGQGEGYNFIDELRGVTGMQDELAQRGPFGDGGTRPNSGLIDAMRGRYTEERDAARNEDAQAQAAHPKTYQAAQIGGAIASPSPVGKLGLGGRLAVGVGQGALTGAGSAPELSDVPADAALGGGVGLLGAGAGEGFSAAGGFFRKGVQGARDVINARNAKALDQGILSARGELGSSAKNTITDIKDLRTEANNVSAPLGARINRWLDSPEAGATLENAVSNKINQAPTRLDEMAAKRDAYSALVNSRDSELASRNAAAEKSPLASVIGPRLSKYAGRALMPAIGGAAGGAVGDYFDAPKTGMALGTAAGMAVGGNPGTAFSNAMRDPRLALGLGKLGVGASRVAAQVPSGSARSYIDWLSREDAKDRLKNDR